MEPQNATIVKLGPSEGSPISVVSFEEAFGEHSEFRGRGRARRQKRKMTRINNRAERKAAKQEARQTRRDTRVTRRLDRKALRKESRQDDSAPDDTNQDDETQTTAQQGQEYQDNSQGYQDNSQQDQGGYQDQGDGQDQSQGQDDNSQSADEAEVMKQFAPDSEDDSSESFDGDADSNSFTSDADGTSVNVDPAIADITKKIVWNQEAKRRVLMQKAELDKKRVANKNDRRAVSQISSQMGDLDMQIEKYNLRIDELNRKLKSYGDHPHIGKGFHQAETQLQKAKEAKSTIDDSAKIKETIVSKSLDPEFGENRIDIPAYPALNQIEIQSSADGGEVKRMPKETLIGALGLLGLIGLLAWATSKD